MEVMNKFKNFKVTVILATAITLSFPFVYLKTSKLLLYPVMKGSDTALLPFKNFKVTVIRNISVTLLVLRAYLKTSKLLLY